MTGLGARVACGVAASPAAGAGRKRPCASHARARAGGHKPSTRHGRCFSKPARSQRRASALAPIHGGPPHESRQGSSPTMHTQPRPAKRLLWLRSPAAPRLLRRRRLGPQLRATCRPYAEACRRGAAARASTWRVVTRSLRLEQVRAHAQRSSHALAARRAAGATKGARLRLWGVRDAQRRARTCSAAALPCRLSAAACGRRAHTAPRAAAAAAGGRRLRLTGFAGGAPRRDAEYCKTTHGSAATAGAALPARAATRGTIQSRQHAQVGALF
jgi:hypothetical protein